MKNKTLFVATFVIALVLCGLYALWYNEWFFSYDTEIIDVSHIETTYRSPLQTVILTMIVTMIMIVVSLIVATLIWIAVEG